MGFLSKVTKPITKPFSGDSVGNLTQILGASDPIASKLTDRVLLEFDKGKGSNSSTPMTPEEITTANLFQSLTNEQKKDLLLNNPNIVTPQGSQIYNPHTNTLSLNESDFTKQERLRQESIAGLLSGQLGQDMPLPSTDPSARFEEARKLLEPQFRQDRERIQQQLANSGLPIGSEAYNEELNRLEQSQGAQLQIAARESVATSEAQRAARFNEISALLGRTQVGAGASFGQFNTNFSGLDLFGAEQSALQRQFQAQQNSKDRSAAQRGALIGAFGSLGGAAAGAALSDITLKENIEEVGKSENGLTIYHFDYINKEYGEGRFEGVMAQDILKSADIVFISGGDVDRGIRVLREKNMIDFLTGLYQQGKLFFGTSAGAIMLAKE